MEAAGGVEEGYGWLNGDLSWLAEREKRERGFESSGFKREENRETK